MLSVDGSYLPLPNDISELISELDKLGGGSVIKTRIPIYYIISKSSPINKNFPINLYETPQKNTYFIQFCNNFYYNTF